MAERRRDELLDDETFERMLEESQTPQQPTPTLPETPAAPVYDDSTRKRQNELYGQIAGRGPFSYDPKNDPLYGIYRDRYVQNGRMAMRDTMGQAAALTGGYGSSYGQAVGQQQYDASLQGLADVIPELYGQAYEQWQDEGDRMLKQYQMLGDQADEEYGRYRDELADWQYERAWQEQQNQSQYGRQQDAYAQLYQLIGSTGYMPSAEELAAAGMSQEAADALRNEYLRQTGQLPAAGGSGNGGPGYNPRYDPNAVPPGDEGDGEGEINIKMLAYEVGTSRDPISDLLRIQQRYGDKLTQQDLDELQLAYEHATGTGRYESSRSKGNSSYQDDRDRARTKKP